MIVQHEFYAATKIDNIRLPLKMFNKMPLQREIVFHFRDGIL